jgi:glycine/D-amino acid oxidase-like deaminating enzyme
MGMAPATGKIIANFISGESQNIDLNPVKPDRYL